VLVHPRQLNTKVKEELGRSSNLFFFIFITRVGVNLPQPSRLDLDPDPMDLFLWDGQQTLYLMDKYNLNIFFLGGIQRGHPHGY
jgi:hypothetical protein